MKRRQIGNSGIEIAGVGYGAMSIAGIYGNATKEDSFAVLDECVELGIDHLDTANVYGSGLSESTIGEWFSARGPDVRKGFSIATKASINTDPETGTRSFDNSRAHLEGELDKSLKRLGVDSVDLFYVHRRDPKLSPQELGGTLKDLIATGKCKSVGISEIAPTTLRRLSEHCPIAAVQSEYSLSTRSPEMGLLQTTRDLGVALVAFSPVGRGLLTDTPPVAEYVQNSGFMSNNPRFTPENLALNKAATQGFRDLAAQMTLPAAGLAVAWLLAQGDHVIPIPGTSNVDHLREVAMGGYIDLDADDLAAIDAVLPIGWAHGDRYSAGQWVGPEKYC